ncbi:MAG TPA: hypothetical protein VL043_11425 [Protaetiibacter sp.]|nr:hypothetical protein [Protaetiibacter sp.]
MDAVPAMQTAIVFVWLGMVLGISFLEAPLKFRAPGITIPLGVGIGRLVFRALNLVEGVFALVLIVTLVLAWPPAVSTAVIVGALVVVLAIGAGVLRPRMDARVRRGELSDGQPRHALHIGFVALETAKVLLLLALGILLLTA